MAFLKNSRNSLYDFYFLLFFFIIILIGVLLSIAITPTNAASSLASGLLFSNTIPPISFPNQPHEEFPSTQTINPTSLSSKFSQTEQSLIQSFASCDIFDGNWVIDDSNPLYPPGSCPFLDDAFDCFKNGRPDSDFLKWRWKPNGCLIPRFDGKQMLEILRGKRLVFVGDSLNRNMWQSLVCALRESLVDKSRIFEVSGHREFRSKGFYSFKFEDYNCSVEFVRAPFLVQEWKSSTVNGTRKETLRLDLIQKSSSIYEDADIIIFNTGHWWTHQKTSRGINYYQEGDYVYSKLNVTEAYTKALHTWAKWVDTNINPNRTRVFFRGYSPSHFRKGWWNSGGHCDEETQPVANATSLKRYPLMMDILESIIKDMTTPVWYLNITKMSDYRRDGHPSIYRHPGAQRSPQMVQDCSHWCLPGIPDAWNELLYAVLLLSKQDSLSA